MVLKAGQQTKHPFQIMALGVEDYPPRFTVASGFATSLRAGDLVFFTSSANDFGPLWAKTWRVAKVEKHTEDTKKVYVEEIGR